MKPLFFNVDLMSQTLWELNLYGNIVLWLLRASVRGWTGQRCLGNSLHSVQYLVLLTSGVELLFQTLTTCSNLHFLVAWMFYSRGLFLSMLMLHRLW